MTAGLAALLLAGGPAASEGSARAPAASANPRLVFTYHGDDSAPRRVHDATVARSASVGLSRENAVRSVTFFVDVEPQSTAHFAIDRTAPFVVPRRGRAGKSPYSLGQHTLRAEVELRSGKRIRLQVKYLVARGLLIAQDIDAATFEHSIESLPPGPLLVRPAAGPLSFAVSGDVVLRRPNLVIDGLRFTGRVEFDPAAIASKLLNSSALGFNLFGPDDVLIQGNTFDGQGRVSSNQIWDSPAGNTPDRWVIRNNTFRNYFIADDPLSHSEAIFVGYSSNGLIEGNTFTKNGTTSHIFFSWFGSTANPSVSYPRNMCVRGNTFNETAGAFVAINFREEIPANAGIVVQRNASSAVPAFWGKC